MADAAVPRRDVRATIRGSGDRLRLRRRRAILAGCLLPALAPALTQATHRLDEIPPLRIHGERGDSVRFLAFREVVPAQVARGVWFSTSAPHWSRRGALDEKAGEFILTVRTRSMPGSVRSVIDSALVRIRLEDGRVMKTHVY